MFTVPFSFSFQAPSGSGIPLADGLECYLQTRGSSALGSAGNLEASLILGSAHQVCQSANATAISGFDSKGGGKGVRDDVDVSTNLRDRGTDTFA